MPERYSSRPMCSCMFERLTWRRWETGGRLCAVTEPGVRAVAQARSDLAVAGRQDVSQRSGRRPTLLRPARQPSPAPRARGGSRKSRRVLRRLWIPLVILVVIGAGGLTVSRLHGIFGSEKRLSYANTDIDSTPFNPKHLTYEVFGPPGGRPSPWSVVADGASGVCHSRRGGVGRAGAHAGAGYR